MTAHIPKVELHSHFESLASPAMIRRLAKRNNMDLPDDMFNEHGDIAWSGFTEFLAAFDKASACIQTVEDYREVAYQYMVSCAQEGAIYMEIFTSPIHAAEVDIDYGSHLEAITRGLEDAEREFGIIGRLIVTCVRHRGPELAVELAKTLAAEPHPYVVGFGMGGNEAMYSCADFAPAFDIAAATGIGCTIHAGEVCGPESVWDALNNLPVTRIGHGVRSIEDPELVAELSARGTVLEMCPGSNFALDIYKDASAHPMLKFIAAGCKVTLGSDDPYFFNTTIGNEYEMASRDFGLSDNQLIQLTMNAIDGAFCDDETKTKLRSKL